jgi:hypothetical protein
VLELAGRVRARRGLAAAAAILALGAALAFVRLHLFHRDHPVTVDMRLRHLALGEEEAGRPDAAIGALQEALAACPGCPHTLDDLAGVYLRSGRAGEGAAWVRWWVRAHPGRGDAAEILRRLESAAGPGGEPPPWR